MPPTLRQCTRAMPGWAHHSRVDQVRGRLLVIFAPIIVLLAATAGLVLAALFANSYRGEMFSAAAVVAVIALLLSIFLLYSQVRRRQATGRALQDAEARVSDIVESAMDPVIAVDQDQRVILFNAAAEKAFLWPRAAVLGEPLDKLIPQRFRSGHRTHIEAFGATGVTSRRMRSQMVLMALRADGEEFPIEASISQHTEEGKKLFTVILRDITERVRAETLLARSEARLRGILDSAMDAIISVDESQHVVLFNAAAEAMFGCPREEAVGAPLAMVHPRALSRRPRRSRSRFRGCRHVVTAHGRPAHRDGPSTQRRRVPDRCVDLAGHRARQQVLYRDSARCHRASAS